MTNSPLSTWNTYQCYWLLASEWNEYLIEVDDPSPKESHTIGISLLLASLRK
jgi:hypothetical protein